MSIYRGRVRWIRVSELHVCCAVGKAADMWAFRGGDVCRWCLGASPKLMELIGDAGPMQAQKLGFAPIVEYGLADIERRAVKLSMVLV